MRLALDFKSLHIDSFLADISAQAEVCFWAVAIFIN